LSFTGGELAPYCFLVNPAADKAHNRSILLQIEEFIRARNDDSVLITTESARSLRREAAEAARRFPILVACGGDGTIREVASGLLGSRTTMGILPLGNGNDLAKTLNIPTNTEDALNLLESGQPTRIDVGMMNGAIFVNTMGIGFDGLANIYAQKYTFLQGRFRYKLAALRAIAGYKAQKIEIIADGRSLNDRYFMVALANGKVEGGDFWVAPKARITDGFLDLVLIRDLPLWRIPGYMQRLTRPDYPDIPYLSVQRVRNVQIRLSQRLPIHMDGEIVHEEELNLDIHIQPAAVEVICGLNIK